MKKVIIIGFLIIGVLMRLQNINGLPIDAHPMRQTDTESVAYNYAFKNANILLPEASLIRPVTNTNGYFFLEFPIYQYTISLLYRIVGWNLVAARVFNLLLFLAASFFLYQFANLIFNKKIAVWSLFFFTFAPGSIFFIGHAIHPDVFGITMFLLSLYTLALWTKANKKTGLLFLSVSALSMSIATRPFIALFIPGILLLLYFYKAQKWAYFAYIFSPVLYGIWRLWQLQFPQADSGWENWVLDGRNELFKIQTLKSLIMKNVVGEVIGKILSLLSIVGLTSIFFKKEKKIWIVLSWLATLPLYWLIVPNGNIIHQYYANIYIVTFSILGAFGVSWILGLLKNRIVVGALSSLLGLLVMYNGYRTSSYFFLPRVLNEHMQIAKAIEKCIPINAKIVYLAVDNSIPMSLVHRQGWVLGYWPTDVDKSVEKIILMKSYGAQYVVSGMGNTDITEEQWNELKVSMKEVCISPFIRVLQFR